MRDLKGFKWGIVRRSKKRISRIEAGRKKCRSQITGVHNEKRPRQKKSLQ